MKRLPFFLLFLLAIAAAFAAGNFLAAGLPSRVAAEILARGLVLAAARILPGSEALWVELLGTAATLPVLLRVLTPDMLLTPPAFLPAFLFLPFYWVICLLLSTLGPMFLFLLFGRLFR